MQPVAAAEEEEGEGEEEEEKTRRGRTNAFFSVFTNSSEVIELRVVADARFDSGGERGKEEEKERN